MTHLLKLDNRSNGEGLLSPFKVQLTFTEVKKCFYQRRKDILNILQCVRNVQKLC